MKRKFLSMLIIVFLTSCSNYQSDPTVASLTIDWFGCKENPVQSITDESIIVSDFADPISQSNHNQDLTIRLEMKLLNQ